MRARVLASLFLAACAQESRPAAPIAVPIETSPAPQVAEVEEPAPPTRRFDPVQEAETLLEVTPTRFARPAFYGPLFATEPDEGTQPLTQRRKEAWEHEVVAVVEERPSSVRILFTEQGVRLVAYLSHEDLRPVVRHRARATLGARDPAPDTGPDGIWIRPGIVAGERVGRFQPADIDEPAFRGKAWVDHRAVDVVYEPDEDPATDARLILAAGSTIAAASGTPLLTTSERLLVTKLTHADARARIRYVSKALLIEGWVPGSQLTPDQVGRLGAGGGGRGWGSSGLTRYLHAGDRLYARQGGELLGVVTSERLRVRDDGEIEAGRGVQVHLGGWSFVPLAITTADADHGDRWEQIYAQRVRLEAIPKGGDLPYSLEVRRREVAQCWEEAVAAGASKAFSLRLTWKRGTRVDVPAPAGMDQTLHSCLGAAFDNLYRENPALPLTFMLELEPIPLPERP